MTERSTSLTTRFSLRDRLLLAAMAAGLSVLLFCAAMLTPDPKGHGTHEQLGLPPCTFYLLFNRPCPSCGMTTAWAWLARGQVVAGLRANVGGAGLALLTACGVPWLMVAAARGRWPKRIPGIAVLTWAGLGMAAATLLQWGWRMFGP